MTVIWEPTKGNHYQAQRGIDESGNVYQMTANLEVVICNTPDDFSGMGWTAQEALGNALAEKEAEQSVSLVAPSDPEAGELLYWTERAEAVLGCPVFIRPGIEGGKVDSISKNFESNQ